MNLLGIDYGERKIGLSLGDTDSKFAEPLMVIRYKEEGKVITKVVQIAKIKRVEKVIIGLSEGKTADKTKEFGKKLETELKLQVEYFDETLSTQEAQRLVIESGMKQKKRHEMEDAFAASLMLQKYLEEN